MDTGPAASGLRGREPLALTVQTYPNEIPAIHRRPRQKARTWVLPKEADPILKGGLECGSLLVCEKCARVHMLQNYT